MKANRLQITNFCKYCGEAACTKYACYLEKKEDSLLEWQSLHAEEIWLNKQIDRTTQTEEETAEGEAFFDNIADVEQAVVEIHLIGD